MISELTGLVFSGPEACVTDSLNYQKYRSNLGGPWMMVLGAVYFVSYSKTKFNDFFFLVNF